MESFLIEYNCKIIGVYSSYELAELFINSCLQNNLMNNSVKILTFKTNSCYCVKENNIKLNNQQQISLLELPSHQAQLQPLNLPIQNQKPVQNQIQVLKQVPVKKVIDPDNPILLDIANQKIELQHKINLLKRQKEKIEESKKVYENDLKLFNIFSESKKLDSSFVVPDLFVKKYNLIKLLKDDNKLSWDNFMKNYHHENDYNDYFDLNSYEEMFIKSNNNIDEELEIESDSETISSNE